MATNGLPEVITIEVEKPAVKMTFFPPKKMGAWKSTGPTYLWFFWTRGNFQGRSVFKKSWDVEGPFWANQDPPKAPVR